MEENKSDSKEADLLDSVELKYIEQIKYHEEDIIGKKAVINSLERIMKELGHILKNQYSEENLKDRGLSDESESILREPINITFNYFVEFKSNIQKEIYRSEGRILQINNNISILQKSHEHIIKKEVRSKVTESKVNNAKNDMDKRRKSKKNAIEKNNKKMAVKK